MKVAALVLSTLVGAGLGADKTLSAGGVSANVLGQSGKITIGLGDVPTADPRRITVDFNSLKECDNTGAATKNGANVNSFATVDFTFGELEETTFAGKDAVMFSFEAPLSPSGKVAVNTYIMKEGGELVLPTSNETYPLFIGTVKFDVIVENFPFSDEGDCLDLEVEVKSLKQETEEIITVDNQTFTLDTGLSVSFASQITVDGVDGVMPEGFPKLLTKNKRQAFVARFPRFSQSVVYDPIINAFPIGTNNAVSAGASLLLASAAFLFASLF